MAQYPALRTTNKGRDLIGRCNINSKAVVYTKAILGDGNYNQDIDTLTAVVSPKMEIPFNSGTDLGNGQWQLEFVVDNSKLASGFYAREIGIYAKADGESDSAAVLLAYTNGGNYVDYIPNKSIVLDAQTILADITVGDADSVVIKMVDGTYATLRDLANHNAATDAHANLRATINDSLSPTSNTATLRTLLSNLGTMIKANKGTATWRDTPPTTLTALAQYMAQMPTGDGIEWNGKKWKNKLTGMSGLNDQNGYISFGPAAAGIIVQWGKGVFEVAGSVSCTLPIACNQVLVALAIDDVQGTDGRLIGWFTSRTDGQVVTFACSGQASIFAYLAICI